MKIKVSKYNSEGYYSPTEYEGMRNVLQEQYEQEKRRQAIENRYKTGMPLIYICSPYRGDVAHNTRMARKYSRFAFINGYNAVAPHLLYTQFLDDNNEFERDMGIRMGKTLLSKCKEVWVFGDYISEGMKKELACAKGMNKPIRYFSTDLQEVKHYGI